MPITKKKSTNYWAGCSPQPESIELELVPLGRGAIIAVDTLAPRVGLELVFPTPSAAGPMAIMA